MDNTERNKQIVDYLNTRMDEIDSKYPEIDVRSRATKALDNIMESPGSFDEVKEKLDKSLDKMIQVFLEKEQSKKEEEVQARNKFDNEIGKANVFVPKEKVFGETYKNPMIEIFTKYEELKDDKDKFNEELKVLISILRQKYKASISSQIIDDIMRGELNGRKEDPLLYIMSDLFRGIDNLDYDLVKSLYDTFINDVTIVSSDFDNNMKFCINGNEALYVLPDDKYMSNDMFFDFRKLVTLFKFAKNHGKKIRLHSLLNSEYVPEDLLAITNKLEVEKKKEYMMSFLEDYLAHLANALKNSGIELDQMDVLDSFNSNEIKYWNELNYVDVFNLVRKYFPNTMLLVNESNEMLDYVLGDFTNMLKELSSKKLIDGIGISSHITEFIEYYGRELKGSDIYDSMLKLSKYNLPIYRTEFDFKGMEDKVSDRDEFINIIKYVDSKCGVSGLILCGNNDLITNKAGEFNKVHVFNDKGTIKKEYSEYVGMFKTGEQVEVLTFNDKDDKASNVVKWASGDEADANVSGNSSNSTPTVIKYSTDEKGFTTSVYALVAVLLILLGFIILAFYVSI